MAIPAIVWLIVGIGVSVISLRVPGLTFFFYIGLIFVGIGLAKIIIKYIFRKKETKQEVKMHKPVVNQCFHCRSQVRSIDSFCWRCGARLR